MGLCFRFLLRGLLAIGLTACQAPTLSSSATPVAWAGSKALEQEPSYRAVDYQVRAIARANTTLNTRALVGHPLTKEEVTLASRTALARLDETNLLSPPERTWVMGQSERWRAGLEGRDASLAFEVGALVRKRSGKDHPSSVETVQALIEGRAGVLDPHTLLVRPDVVNRYDQAALRLGTLGLHVRWVDGQIQVDGMVPGGPAQSSGKIQVGDILIAVRVDQGAWQRLGWMDDARRWLQAPARTLALRLTHQGKLVEVVLHPGPINQEALRATMETLTAPYGHSYAALRLEASFFYEGGSDGKTLADDVRDALTRSRAANGKNSLPDVVILDLRQCRGGSVPVALDLASAFLPAGTAAIHIEGSDARIMNITFPGNAHFTPWTGPVQVWVGPHTASAAEIVAQALHDREGQPGTTVGWPTYGKGTLQRRIDLDLDSSRRGQPSRLGELWFTTEEIFGTDGRSLQKHGVELSYRLPNAAAEPWGERSLPGALEPRTGASHGAAPDAPLLSSVPALTPLMPEAEALPLWQRAGGEALQKAQEAWIQKRKSD